MEGKLTRFDIQVMALVYWQSDHVMKKGKLIHTFTNSTDQRRQLMSINKMASMEMIDCGTANKGKYKGQQFPMLNAKSVAVLEENQSVMREAEEQFFMLKVKSKQKRKGKKHG